MQGHEILLLTELFLPTKGGTAVWAAEVYKRLGGKRIHIVTAKVPGSEEVDVGHANTVHRLRLQRIPWLKPESLGIYVSLTAKSLALAVTQRFQDIHAMRALPEGGVAWLVSRLTRKPLLIYAHGEELTGWGRGPKYAVMRFVLRQADMVVANSDFTRDELRSMGVRDRRIIVIYPGVDVQRFQPGLPYDDLKRQIDLATREKLILSVGRLSRRKGFDMVIRSLPGLLELGISVRYAIIGIGEDQEYLAKLAGEQGVADRVHFLGHVDMADLPRWYNACDVFVMPNRNINGDTEGFGMVYIEAAACGKPALAGRDGGTGSAVLDQQTGFRVDGTSVAAVTNALARFLGDYKLTEEFGNRARERATKEFSWEEVACKTSALIRGAD